MTFVRIFMISLLCYKRLINCQSIYFNQDNQNFFNNKITVDYSTCNHPFYFYKENEGDYLYEGDDYADDYADDSCKR